MKWIQHNQECCEERTDKKDCCALVNTDHDEAAGLDEGMADHSNDEYLNPH